MYRKTEWVKSKRIKEGTEIEYKTKREKKERPKRKKIREGRSDRKKLRKAETQKMHLNPQTTS